MLDRLLRRLFRNKDELLRVLDRPEIPLNTNASENDIRAFVTKRKISGGTVSDNGRDARDIMIGLAKTCMKLNVVLPIPRRSPRHSGHTNPAPRCLYPTRAVLTKTAPRPEICPGYRRKWLTPFSPVAVPCFSADML